MSHILFTGKVLPCWEEKWHGMKKVQLASSGDNLKSIPQNSWQYQSDTQSYKAIMEEVAEKEAHTYVTMKNHALFRARQQPSEKILSNGREEWQEETRAYG